MQLERRRAGRERQQRGAGEAPRAAIERAYREPGTRRDREGGPDSTIARDATCSPAASAPVTLARRWPQTSSTAAPADPAWTARRPRTCRAEVEVEHFDPPGAAAAAAARSHVLTGALIAIGVAAVFVIVGVLLGAGRDTTTADAAAA